MMYGYDKTIHATQKLNIEVDHDGNVVSVWFRCMALPFDVHRVDYDRAAEMRTMSERVNQTSKLKAVDVESSGLAI